jgi:glycosyltransferase involved in cell wall biosynthesis
LESLAAQDYKNFEVLVVDNACEQDLDEFLATKTFGSSLSLRYLAEPRPGVHHARHKGAEAALNELLLFTDDDATFAVDWVRAYADAFRAHPEMAAAGGPVHPAWDVDPPQWLLTFMKDERNFYPLSTMDRGDRFLLESRKGYFFSVNMGIRRPALEAAGGFHPEATGSAWLGDGETGLYFELWRRELAIGYVPTAIAYHHIPSERTTLRYLRHRMRNEGAAAVYTKYHPSVPDRGRLLLDSAGVCLRSAPYWIGSMLLLRSTEEPAVRLHVRTSESFSRVKHTLRLGFDRDYRRLVEEPPWKQSV